MYDSPPRMTEAKQPSQKLSKAFYDGLSKLEPPVSKQDIETAFYYIGGYKHFPHPYREDKNASNSRYKYFCLERVCPYDYKNQRNA